MYSTPIPFPLFEPDKSPFLFSAGDNLVNCLPVADGWGPMPAFVDISTALPSECLGAIFIKAPDNTITIFAGTQSDLYKLDTSTTPYSWINVSSSAGVYDVPVGDRWGFTEFGNYLIAHNLGGQAQVLDYTSSDKFADLPDAPIAKHSWVAGDFLVFGYLDGRPNTIQWSGINDHTHWEIGRRGSGVQKFLDGGGISGGVGDQQGATIIFRDKIRRMQFMPQSGFVFVMQDVNTSRGAVAPYSIANISPSNYLYLSEDGFFSGPQGAPIGAERVDRWFFERVDLSRLFDVRSAIDPFNKVVYWRYQNIEGNGALIGYNWQLDRWLYSDVVLQHAAPIVSPGITIDGLDQLFSSIDDINVPFDSRLFSGGRPVFAAFTTENKLAFATGGALPATLRTPLLELTPSKRSFVRGFRFVSDARTFTGRIGNIAFHGDEPTYTNAITPSTRGKTINARVSGRLHNFEVSIPAAENWSVASTIQVDQSPEGDL